VRPRPLLRQIRTTGKLVHQMNSGPAPSAQNSFAILSRRRIPE
jgi:hypothetical protein